MPRTRVRVSGVLFNFFSQPPRRSRDKATMILHSLSWPVSAPHPLVYRHHPRHSTLFSRTIPVLLSSSLSSSRPRAFSSFYPRLTFFSPPTSRTQRGSFERSLDPRRDFDRSPRFQFGRCATRGSRLISCNDIDNYYVETSRETYDGREMDKRTVRIVNVHHQSRA